jgi:hypothetical protein
MTVMPAGRATLATAPTWSARSGPRIRLAPSATALLAACDAPPPVEPVSLRRSEMLSAIAGLASI